MPAFRGVGNFACKTPNSPPPGSRRGCSAPSIFAIRSRCPLAKAAPAILQILGAATSVPVVARRPRLRIRGMPAFCVQRPTLAGIGLPSRIVHQGLRTPTGPFAAGPVPAFAYIPDCLERRHDDDAECVIFENLPIMLTSSDALPLSERILGAYDDMTKSERRLADLLLGNGDALVLYSASDLSERHRSRRPRRPASSDASGIRASRPPRRKHAAAEERLSRDAKDRSFRGRPGRYRGPSGQ